MSRIHAWRSPARFMIFAAFWLYLPLNASAAGTQLDPDALHPALERIGSGIIDWQRGEYRAVVTAPVPERHRGREVIPAMGEELARRVAKALADSVFLQLAAATRVDAARSVRELAGDEAHIRLLGNIAGREELSVRPVQDSGRPAIQFTFRVPMRGVSGVIANLYDRVVTVSAAPARPATPPAGANVLYIDARGTGAQPALFPRILDTDGELVYDAGIAGREKSIRDGVVEYVTPGTGTQARYRGSGRLVRAVAFESVARLLTVAESDDRRKGRKRVKRGTVLASSAAGLLKANIIISKGDASRLRDQEGQGWLRNARVIVVTDSALGGTEGRLPRDGDLRYAKSGR